jgi:hypothetical protein
VHRSIGAAIALFAALASAEVLVRLAVDANVANRSEHVLFPLAFAGLAASLFALALLAIAGTRSKRLHAPIDRQLRRPR